MKRISVFIILLVEIENISQNNCVTKQIYFAMFPAAHYRQSPQRSEYGLLGHEHYKLKTSLWSSRMVNVNALWADLNLK